MRAIRNGALAVLAILPMAQITRAQTAPAPIVTGPPPVVVTMPPRPNPSAPPPPSSPLRAVAATHTMPPYPPDSVTAQEQGTTVVEVHIVTDGSVDDCKILYTSGFDRLDQAACEHVKAVWRWQPPTLDGKPVAVSTRISIKFDLKLAQPQ